MQSTGHSSTRDLSMTSMQGSPMVKGMSAICQCWDVIGFGRSLPDPDVRFELRLAVALADVLSALAFAPALENRECQLNAPFRPRRSPSAARLSRTSPTSRLCLDETAS